MKTFKEFLNEEKLARVWKHASQEGSVFSIITAFRGNFSKAKNLSKLNDLKADLRSLGYGFWVLSGTWYTTDPTTGKKLEESERSLFVSVPVDKIDGVGFRKNMIELCKKYDQDAIVIRSDPKSDNVNLYQYQESEYSDNEQEDTSISKSKNDDVWIPKLLKTRKINKEFSIGKFKPQKIGDAWSKIDKSGRTFVFENLVDYNPFSFASALVKGYNDRILKEVESGMTTGDAGIGGDIEGGVLTPDDNNLPTALSGEVQKRIKRKD